MGALFVDGPIEIVVQRPLLCIRAPAALAHPWAAILLILREELEVSGSLPTPSQAAG